MEWPPGVLHEQIAALGERPPTKTAHERLSWCFVKNQIDEHSPHGAQGPNLNTAPACKATRGESCLQGVTCKAMEAI